MIGIGAANLAAGLFQGFPVSTSGSRTAVAERSGAKTQLTGVTGAVLIILMIVLVPGLFRNLPQPALAAVVITASLSLADIPGTVRLWRQRKAEFLPVDRGVPRRRPARRAARDRDRGRRCRSSTSSAGRGGPTTPSSGAWTGWRATTTCTPIPQAEHLPGLVIYRFDAPLFFANAKTFRDEVRRLARADPPPTWIVIAAEPMTDVDTTASDVLEELDEALNAQGISLVFAELKDPVRRKIERYGLTRTINPRHFFPTIEAAVAAFRARDRRRLDRRPDSRGPGAPRPNDRQLQPSTRHSRITHRSASTAAGAPEDHGGVCPATQVGPDQKLVCGRTVRTAGQGILGSPSREPAVLPDRPERMSSSGLFTCT